MRYIVYQTILYLILLVINAQKCYSQESSNVDSVSINCSCSFFSYEKNNTLLVFKASPDRRIVLCSYEKPEAKSSIALREFEIFDCNKKVLILKSQPMSSYLITAKESKLFVKVIKDLPKAFFESQEELFLEQPFLNQTIFLEDNIFKIKEELIYKYPKIDSETAQKIIAEFKGSKHNAMNYEIANKLFFLVFNENKEARDILLNYQKYFERPFDGEYAEWYSEILDLIKIYDRVKREKGKTREKLY